MDNGFAKICFYESQEGRVLRVVQVLEDGRTLKHAITRPHYVRAGAESLYWFEPRLPNGGPGTMHRVSDVAIIEWSTLEEFDQVWERAHFMDEN